ncbi:MAG: dimethyl sulfoxide reductase anchor subunit [Gammaproteobacteria bacterium]|nr:dimethyl sulfoxide reductase anchor subunit [Gammaproteobacteria bacterium]
MHPAFSVLIFTVTAGAGYGLLGWLSANEVFGFWLLSVPTKLVIGVIAMVLISIGLVASTQHLANPKNAWRSFSRWRSSWLSREAVLAIMLYPIAALYAAAIYFTWSSIILWAGLCLLLSLAIVFVTAMIYASLKTIRQWHHPLVPTLYLLFATISGGLAWAWLLAWNGVDISALANVLAVLVAFTALLKLGYFICFKVPGTIDIQSATGFSNQKVSILDAGHSAPSFLNNEFMYDVAQTKLVRMRWMMMLATFAVPLCTLCWVPDANTLFGAFVVMMAGLLAERWLFFAEARHVVRLLHGQQRV